MTASMRATIVDLRHAEDELSVARSKPARQALDTLVQVRANVDDARRQFHEAASLCPDPQRLAQLNRAITHIEGALAAAELALDPRAEDHLAERLDEIVEHLIIATTCAEDD